MDFLFSLNIGEALKNLWESTGIFHSIEFGEWKNYIMIAISLVLFYLAIVKKFEPLLLVPIAFGMMLANIPGASF